jgi:hypothetical protein
VQLENLERFPDELNGKVLSQQCVDLTGREADDFEVQISRLPTEREIPDRAADQPDPSASAPDCVFDTSKDFP